MKFNIIFIHPFDNMNSWAVLVIAGLFEMAWVLSLKFSNNFTNLFYTILVAVFMILSLGLLSVSFKSIPMGTAYACWTAIGAIGVIVFGILFLGESGNALRLFFIALIIAGVIGLNLTTH